jgi:hypothetical protein
MKVMLVVVNNNLTVTYCIIFVHNGYQRLLINIVSDWILKE